MTVSYKDIVTAMADLLIPARPAEGRPGRRHGPRPQPGAAHRAVPPGRPDGRHHRPVLPGWSAEQADDPRRGGPRPRRDGIECQVRPALPGLGHDPSRVLAD